MLGPYQLLDRIGVGGMAEVWRATVVGAAGFERPIAIKRILGHLSADDDFIQMFVDEAKIAVRLSHPNIVQIHDLGHSDGEWYIAMELVFGKDLRAVIDAEAARGQRMPLEVALHTIMKVCDALHHAHFGGGEGLRIVHRDVSPQNVLVSYEGEVKVTDFGLAKAAGRASQTQAGTVKGKLAYMSPEQLRGRTLDQRSDVFAVGILLWELLSGERLFLGKSDQETIKKAYMCQIPSLCAMDPSIPRELEQITNKALAMQVDDRYATAMELHDDLEAFVYGNGLLVSSGSIAAYMRALFPQIEASAARPRIDAVSEDDLEDAEELEELDADVLESVRPGPATIGPAARRAQAAEAYGATPLEDAVEALDSIAPEADDFERSKTEPPTMIGDDWDDGTASFDAGFAEAEPTPEFDSGFAQDALSPYEHSKTGLDDDALYAAALAARPPPEDLVTRLHGPSEQDLRRSRENDELAASAELVASPELGSPVPTEVPASPSMRNTARPARKRQEPAEFEDFDDETTTAGIRRR